MVKYIYNNAFIGDVDRIVHNHRQGTFLFLFASLYHIDFPNPQG